MGTIPWTSGVLPRKEVELIALNCSAQPGMGIQACASGIPVLARINPHHPHRFWPLLRDYGQNILDFLTLGVTVECGFLVRDKIGLEAARAM